MATPETQVNVDFIRVVDGAGLPVQNTGYSAFGSNAGAPVFRSESGVEIALTPTSAVYPDIPSNSITPSGVRTTTLASYADVDGANAEISITKQSGTTDILVTLYVETYSTVGGTVVSFAIKEGAIDYDALQFTMDNANFHVTASGICRIIGLTAGAKTLRLRWKRVVGAGTISIASGYERIYMTAQEVA